MKCKPLQYILQQWTKSGKLMKLCMCQLFNTFTDGTARLQATGNCSSTFCSTHANTAMLASHVPKRSLTSISFVLRNISLNHTIVMIIYIEATKSINVKLVI